MQDVRLHTLVSTVETVRWCIVVIQSSIPQSILSVERINSQLKKVREQIAQLQAKEKDLAEQKQMAEDAEAMKIIRKYKISSERLQMLNKLSEDEVRNLLQKREQEKEVSTNENEEVIR